MEKKTYTVFCADCHMKYEQTTEFRPPCCGACGSTWIAVKEHHNHEDCCNRCLYEDENGNKKCCYE